MIEDEKRKSTPAAPPLSATGGTHRPESGVFGPLRPTPDIGEMALSLLLNFQGIAFRCDMNFKPIFLLGAVKAVTGRDPQDFFTGKAAWKEIIRGDDIAAGGDFPCLLDTFAREYAIAQPQGGVRWVREMDQKLCNADGHPIIQGMIYDITERKIWEEALKHSEEKYRTLVESSTDVILLLDGSRSIQSCNQAFLNTFGFNERREVEGQSIRIIHLSDKNYADYGERVYRFVETRDTFRTEWNLARKDGTAFPAEVSTSAVRDADGGISSYVVIIRDITDRKRQERKLTFLAMHDHLTGLPNRTLFADRLHQAIVLAGRKKHFVSVMYLDLDHFKHINDTYGHGTGDELLKAVGARLKDALRETDTVARMGGDEFILLLSDLKRKEDTVKIARKIIAALRSPLDAGGRLVQITPSIGISVYPDDGDTFEILAKNADLAMYHAKENGRNSYALYTSRLEYRY